MEPDIPLVVPEVNAKEIANYKNRGIIANPNCSTIQMVVALKPIHDAARIKRVVVSTYQSVSGAGRKAMDELSQQVAALFNGQEIEKKNFRIRSLLIVSRTSMFFWKTATPKKRWKMIDETRKILGEPNLPVTATTVRVPVFCSHSESVNVETVVKLSAAETKRILREAPGVIRGRRAGRIMFTRRRLTRPVKTPLTSAGFAKTIRSPMVSISGSYPTICAKARRSTPCRSPKF